MAFVCWLIGVEPVVSWEQVGHSIPENSDYAYFVQQTSDNEYIIAGTTYSFGPSWDPNFWLIRLAGLHDITIQNVFPQKTVVGEGYSVFVNVAIKNWGTTETFNVTVYANKTNIETQLVTIASGNSTTVAFTWNTTGFAKGNYTISAVADTVPGETDEADNTGIGGLILISKVGDLGGGLPPQFFACDGAVDGLDVALFRTCYLGLGPDR